MADAQAMTPSNTLPHATLLESINIFAQVLGPTWAKGVIIRRPAMVGIAESLGLDKHAVRYMQKLRDKYGNDPLLLRLPKSINYALVFMPEHVHRVLQETHQPFATDSREKHAALAHFQPHGVLISQDPERSKRRHFNEAVLDTALPVHRLADHFMGVIHEEASQLLNSLGYKQQLDWERFAISWFRIVRRVVFGNAARDDEQLTQLVNKLRGHANWAFMHPKNDKLQQQLHSRINHYIQLAAQSGSAPEPSLAALIASTPQDADTAPADQVAHWLFAFDPAGMTVFRALALLASHPQQAAQAQTELKANTGSSRQYLPYLRACILEALRLWPTTPVILRQSKTATQWDSGMMPANTGLIIYTPLLHRDDENLSYANTFAPEVWLDQQHTTTAQQWPLLPFSDGPAVCPARNLVLLLTSNMLAQLLESGALELRSSRLSPKLPLPGTLSPYRLRFKVKG
jgi:cytochrome P450